MIGIGGSYVSGDYDPNDDQLNTFDPMYPKPVYGLAMAQGPVISHILNLLLVYNLWIDYTSISVGITWQEQVTKMVLMLRVWCKYVLLQKHKVINMV